MSGQRLLSICIPTLNRCECLDELLTTIVGQQLADSYVRDFTEICISDNCSPDETRATLNKWKSIAPNLKFTRTASIIGFPENLLNVTKLASGVYVWLLGDDDLIMPNAIRAVLGELEREKRELTFLLLGEISYCRETNRFEGNEQRRPERKYSIDEPILSDFTFEGIGHMSRLVLRRDMLNLEVYESRERWELMPFLRWVTFAIKSGPQKSTPFAAVLARYIKINPHWHGKWMFVHACEIPELVRTVQVAPRSAIKAKLLHCRKHYLRGYVQVSLLRDGYPAEWSYAKQRKMWGASPIISSIIDVVLSSSLIRRIIIKILAKMKPDYLSRLPSGRFAQQ